MSLLSSFYGVFSHVLDRPGLGLGLEGSYALLTALIDCCLVLFDRFDSLMGDVRPEMTSAFIHRLI